MKKTSLEKINFRYDSSFGEFDFELLYRAKQLGFRIKEIPFIYRFREKGKSKMEKSSGFLSFLNLFKSALFAYFKRALQLKFET